MKKVFDEIHGYIELNDMETKIMDSPVFQRLRRIRQTSLAFLVYPGAMHTRFSHSLGTFHLATRVGNRLINEGHINHDEALLLRLASLLHDIGQFPFSHSLEPIYISRDKVSSSVIRDFIIYSDKEIEEALGEYSIDKKQIVDIYNTSSMLGCIIDSDVDIDRMDYLLRDSRHTGVQLGNLDLERLIDTVSYNENKIVNIIEKGLNTLENFYISRLHMYQAVYYHKTILGYELYMRELYRQVMEYCCPEVLTWSFLKESIQTDSFPYWDDEWVYSKLHSVLSDENAPDQLKFRIKNFLDRKGPKMVYENVSFNDFQRSSMEMSEIVSKLQKYGIPEDSVYPFEEIIRIIDKSKLKVNSKKGQVKNIAELQNTLLNSIPNSITIRRIYVDYTYAKRARELIP
ncbi:HD domain-containing protein [Sulfolobus acidocaldarius]|uniref:Conserved protein n=4 Tax=Sulfolobus acidocaldarius TaxID=2285 RepID=Q4J8P5_SULAC|nr:HD domain-containing protein [Sulfolobus acidocaldarius]AAY80836.1 conserved protein [Sulfolobus acidocaldarius DSM 639]AGE71437.1 hypothetical protein SacN8_07365 [Sulfolobus acidocaldarius N8]AGE73710.1 hypothetical protein SacRon12I_07375 [Sulfolobus acidocaldarius Ron12/I]ALU30321.1 phosphohydrolase [Sulfolobus acidocaldarius]ALU31039.1 phosphohydrolase [Sulfolobus acidocaldarius]